MSQVVETMELEGLKEEVGETEEEQSKGRSESNRSS
jgi:hypothetical protein